MSKQSGVLEPLLDQETVQRWLDTFALALGLPVWFQRAGEEKLLASGSCSVCKRIQQSPEGRHMCAVSIKDGGMLAFQTGDAYTSRCHAGLVRMSVPVICEGTYQGTFSCGPVLLWEWDDFAVKEIAALSHHYGVTAQDVSKSMPEIQTLTPARMRAVCEMLKSLALMVGGEGTETLRARRERAEQQAKLAEIILEKKRTEEAIQGLETWRYPIQKEQELLSKVRLGDRHGAKEILNELLGTIFLWNAGNIETVKARSLELVVVISRAAVEVGAQLEALLGMNYNYIQQLSTINEFDALCQWLVRVLDTFVDRVYETRNVKSARFLGDALAYIREHYAKSLTLEDVAQRVYISPYYLSHLFKEELGITFVEYVTRARMEEARRLLMMGDLPIQQVARQVGYEDAGYFTKVFKKISGVTPNQYKKGL